jgi:hypothetical protein
MLRSSHRLWRRDLNKMASGRPGAVQPAKPLTLNFVGELRGDVLVVHKRDASDVPEERLKRVANPPPGQTARLGCNAAAC